MKADEASDYNTLPQGESYHGLYDNEEQFRLVDNFSAKSCTDLLMCNLNLHTGWSAFD